MHLTCIYIHLTKTKLIFYIQCISYNKDMKYNYNSIM